MRFYDECMAVILQFSHVGEGPGKKLLDNPSISRLLHITFLFRHYEIIRRFASPPHGFNKDLKIILDVLNECY